MIIKLIWKLSYAAIISAECADNDDNIEILCDITNLCC